MNKPIPGIKYISLLIGVLISTLSLNAQEEELNLSKAIEKALESNYGITISESAEEIASINNNWGNAGRYPTISFTASSINSMELLDPTSMTNILNGAIGLNWTIFNGFKVNVTKEKLEKLEDVAKGRTAVVVESTIQDVIMSYYNILLQMERQNVLEKVMILSQDRYEYEKVRYDIGGAVTYNVLQAKNIYLNDKAAYLNQEVVVRNAVRNLNFLLGESPYEQWNFPGSLTADTSSYVLADLLDKMLANNQTLQNQYINLLIQKDEIDLQQSNLYPSLRLSLGLDNGYNRIDRDGSPLITSESVSPYGNLTLSWNIYTGGTRKRAVQVARINEEITMVETDEMKHSLSNQLINEHELYNVRKTLLQIAEESVEAADLSLQIAEEKYKSGAINSFNYRDIQLSYLSSALQLLQAKFNLINSQTNLTRLTGGFIEEQE